MNCPHNYIIAGCGSGWVSPGSKSDRPENPDPDATFEIKKRIRIRLSRKTRPGPAYGRNHLDFQGMANSQILNSNSKQD